MGRYELNGAWVFSVYCRLAFVVRRELIVRGQEVKRQLKKHVKQAPVKPTEHKKNMESLLTEGPFKETRVTVLPVEPYLVHVYWEASSDELDQLRRRLSHEYSSSEAVLRFYDVTNVVFDGTNAHSCFDVRIDLDSKSSYVHLWSPEKWYCVELGFKTKDGICLPLARSNIVRTPRPLPAPRADNRFVFVEQDADGSLLSTEVRVEPFLGDGKPASEPGATAEIGNTHSGWEAAGAKEQPLDPKGSQAQELDRPDQRDSEPDLTEMNEKRFIFGLSS